MLKSVSKSTIQNFIHSHKNDLDRLWAEKWPNGCGFILINRFGDTSFGWLIQRPTSHTNRFDPNLPRCGAYLGASFRGTKKLLFTDQEKWLTTLNTQKLL